MNTPIFIQKATSQARTATMFHIVYDLYCMYIFCFLILFYGSLPNTEWIFFRIWTIPIKERKEILHFSNKSKTRRASSIFTCYLVSSVVWCRWSSRVISNGKFNLQISIIGVTRKSIWNNGKLRVVVIFVLNGYVLLTNHDWIYCI